MKLSVANMFNDQSNNETNKRNNQKRHHHSTGFHDRAIRQDIIIQIHRVTGNKNGNYKETYGKKMPFKFCHK